MSRGTASPPDIRHVSAGFAIVFPTLIIDSSYVMHEAVTHGSCMLLHCGWEGSREGKGQRVPLAQRSVGGMRVVSAAAGMSDHLGYVMRCISDLSLEGLLHHRGNP